MGCSGPCFLTPSYPGQGMQGERDSWGPFRVWGSQKDLAHLPESHQRTGKWSIQLVAPVSGTGPGPKQTFGGGGNSVQGRRREERGRRKERTNMREGRRRLELLHSHSFSIRLHTPQCSREPWARVSMQGLLPRLRHPHPVWPWVSPFLPLCLTCKKR